MTSNPSHPPDEDLAESLTSDPLQGSEDASEPQTGGHVSVVYFHGMGNQRRHEEVSRLVDALNAFAIHSKDNPSENVGFLSKIRPRLEPSDSNKASILTYIRLYHRESRKAPWTEALGCRFYEVYWAPVMAKSSSIREILLWLFSNILRPWQTIRSQWRDRQRLRRAALFRLMERPQVWPKDCLPKDFFKVFKAYDQFEGTRARHKYPSGSFKEFLSFVEDRFKRKPVTVQRLHRLAESWKKSYYLDELRNTFFLITLGLTLILLALLGVGLVVMILKWVSGMGLGGWLDSLDLPELKKSLEPTFTNAIPLLISVAGLLGLTRFLTKYLGDVERWTTFEETNEKYEDRKEVITRGIEILTHVLKDEQCKRVAVVGHSLGTAVAHDTLLELARYNRAHNLENPMAGPLPLEKIQHFITLASPIDKIQYLFESYYSQYHRYNRVVEELRGDIGEAPFSKNGKPHIHWINYWDEGDIISGSLQSPSNRRLFSLRVDNVHTSSLHFPDPGWSHSAYFENRDVIKTLFHVFFKDAHNFHDAPLIPNQGYDYESQFLGPGTLAPGTKRYLFLMILTPYLLLFNILVHVIELPAWGSWVRWIAGGILGGTLLIILSGFLYNHVHGPRNPLKNR